MSGAVYDIAVNLDGLEGETDAALPGIPFAEGWHPMDLDYVKDLGLHSTAITLTSPGPIRDRVVTALAKANHISIFGTGYPGSDGAHIVHYKGRGPGRRDRRQSERADGARHRVPLRQRHVLTAPAVAGRCGVR